jgi:hypothetical protein
MSTDLIRGTTMRWTFADGPMKGHSYEHVFASDGTVTYRQLDEHDGGKKQAKEEAKPTKKAAAPPAPISYQLEEINPDVFAVSYLSPGSGYTLTSVLDLRAGKVTSFASNAKEVVVQHGTIDKIDRARA